MRRSLYPDHTELWMVENGLVFCKLCWVEVSHPNLFLLISFCLTWFDENGVWNVDGCCLMIICVCSIGIFGTFWVFWKNHVEGDEEHLAVFGCCVFPADFPATFIASRGFSCGFHVLGFRLDRASFPFETDQSRYFIFFAKTRSFGLVDGLFTKMPFVACDTLN